MSPIGNVTSKPYGLVEFSAGSAIMMSADLVEAAKKNPGKLSTGGPGAGGMMELVHNILNKTAINAQYGPFAGSGPSKVAYPPVLS
jgi:tripartite-type tricarboxylate transporter receptor subunit TctC